MRVRVVSGYDEFVALKEEWNGLLARSLQPMVFLTHQWMDVWWRNFGEGKELFIVLVSNENGELSAIAPLMCCHGTCNLTLKPNVKVRARKIEFIANEHSNRCDLILSANPGEACRAMVRFFLEDGKDAWDLLDLQYLLKDSPSLRYLKEAAQWNRLPIRQSSQMFTPYIPLTPSWNDYFNGLRSKFRTNMRNCRNKLQRQGKERFSTYETIEGLDVVLEEVFSVAAKSWKASQGTDLTSMGGFYTDLAYAAAKEGWLRICVLYLEDIPLAFDYSLRYEGTNYDLKTEFDEAYRSLGPGNLLKSRQLECLCETDCRVLDFLAESTPWKMEWSQGHQQEHVFVQAFNKTLRGLILHSISRIKELVADIISKVV